LEECTIIDLPKYADSRGNLSVIEGGINTPFDIRRIYYLYDVPDGFARAGHGHKELQQVFIAISGSFDVIVDDGFTRKKIHLDRPEQGLYIPKMMWRDVENFSSDAICLVLASCRYDKEDYYHDYDEFVTDARNEKQQGDPSQ